MDLANASRRGVWLLAACVLGLAVSLGYFFFPDGIDGSIGAGIVIGSTALMVLASAAITFFFPRGWIKGVLAALILLDILGTGFAAYMLDAYVLIACMALVFLAWLFLVFLAGPARRPLAEAQVAP